MSGSPEAPRIRTTELPEIDNIEPPNYDLVPLEPLEPLPSSSLFGVHPDAYGMPEDDDEPKRPLIAPLVPMEALRAEYEGGSPIFVKQIEWLTQNGFIGIRRARGDGDCFYRALAFAYVDRILHSADPQRAAKNALQTLQTTRPLLDQAGFQQMVYEDFYDVFTALLQQITFAEPGKEPVTPAVLLQAFNDPETSNSIVVYLRLLTSAQLRGDPGNYEPFLFHPETSEPMSLRDFCENFVEAVGKEADHVQITALSRVLQVNVSVAYLDGHANGPDGHVDFVQFENTEEFDIEPVILLYRPGHYDILDRREEEPLEGGLQLDANMN